MSGATNVVLGTLLFAFLLGAVALMLWQEGRRRSFDTTPTYIIEDAVGHIAERLDPDVLDRVGIEGVERIIGWEVRYLQAGPGVSPERPAVAGGHESAVAFIVERTAEIDGLAYAPGDVSAILALEANYLVAIGAVGAEVTDRGARS